MRHHSPAAALAVERRLLARRPRLVLVEAPSDASDLIPLLLQGDTRPPVAILAYRPAADGAEPRTVAVPFCDYSPELVALRVAMQTGAQSRFCDAPAAAWLDLPEPAAAADAEGESLPDAQPADLFHALAERAGFGSHDEFWDSRVEMAAPADGERLIGEYGDMVRDWLAAHGAERPLDPAREAWMLAEVRRALAEGYRPEEVAVVCGAAHAAGLRAARSDEAQVAALRGLPPARFALIPYSYPRLAEQLGYGAGNRAPAFYQEVWQRRGDWHGATLALLLELLNALRGRGLALSLADAIEARRLAANLAGLRDKPAAGLEEVRDAAVACYGRGTYDAVAVLDHLLIGEEVGAVSARAARTALQQEFLDQIKRYGIPFGDSPRDLRLNLTNAGERAASTFLHRLGIAGVPFARLARAGAATPAKGDDAIAQLLALREKWEVRWTPATDVRLLTLAAHGDTLLDVCARLLRGKLAAARGLAGAADVLRDVVVGRLDSLSEEVLAACERASGEDDDLASLGHACYLLDVLVDYGEGAGQAALLSQLEERAFSRAALLLPAAAAAADEEAGRLAEALKALQQVTARRAQRGQSVALLLERLRATALEAEDAHGSLAGLACAMLYLDGELADEELVGALRLRLSRGEEPLRAAQFVEGLFGLNRSVLVRNRAVIGSLSEFLVGLEREQFVAVLPLLRRSLGGLGPSEMGYLLDTIAAALAIKADGGKTAAPNADQMEELAALDKELGDLFG